MAVLKLTVTLDDGTQTSTLVFEKGALDPEAMQFSATSSVANRGAAQMVGTFGSNGLLTGNLEAEGYPERGGSFVLTLNAPIPSLQGVKTRASEENKFLFNSFSGQGNFATPQNPPTSPVSTTPDKNVHLVTMRQASTQVQNFMDIITSYRTLDASIYLSWTDSSGFGHNNGAIFQNSVWDSRAKTLTGTYSVPATGISQGTELKLSCSQSGMGWNCTQTSLMAGVLFTVTFMPDPAH